MPPPPPETKPRPPASPNWRSGIWPVILMLVMLWIWQDLFMSLGQEVHTIPYSQFKQFVAERRVKDCVLTADEAYGTIVAHPLPAPTAATKQDTPPKESAGAKPATSVKVPAPPEAKPADAKPADVKVADAKPADAKADEADGKFVFRTVRIEDPKLVEDMEAAGVEFKGERPSFLSQFLLSWVLPIGLMMLFWLFISRRIGSVGQSVMGFGKSRARIVADKETGVTFGDVAGCDEAKQDLEEVVDFLKNPARYSELGAKIPKGVLLVGPPGTGKTLLARAVAGEAHVRFFSLSGSEFVEMFVGVGALRVRDLFEQAKAAAPCIIFIDELDAIGRERGVHMGPVNDEREQTLNQLLVEMDGFAVNVGVILLAATNRPEVLDRALLRPGRFDRQVLVDAPDVDGREAILRIHCRNKPLAADVNLRRIAQATPGFSGADLANAMNEAALLAARDKAVVITQQDLEEAIEKVVAGPERKSRRLEEKEKRRVAYHEVGHALVSHYGLNPDRLHKISIVPRGRAALGYTMQLPTEEQFLLTQSELMDRIRGLLGGRAAEEIMFSEVSTGAENDLEKATALARQMICMYGMNEAVGLAHCAAARVVHAPRGGRRTRLQRADGRDHRRGGQETAQLGLCRRKAYFDRAPRAARSRGPGVTQARELGWAYVPQPARR